MKFIWAFAFGTCFLTRMVGAQCTPIRQNEQAKEKCVVEGVVAGGSGGSWGPMHTITSPEGPNGFRVESVSFRLEGPHSCFGHVSYPSANQFYGARTDIRHPGKSFAGVVLPTVVTGPAAATG